MQKRRGFKPDIQDEDTLRPEDILDEQAQETVIEKFKEEDDQRNYIFKANSFAQCVLDYVYSACLVIYSSVGPILQYLVISINTYNYVQLLMSVCISRYMVFAFNKANPDSPTFATESYFESEIIFPRMYQSCIWVSLMVTLLSPVFLYAPSTFNPGVIPTRDQPVSMWTVAFYIHLMVSIIPLAAMVSLHGPHVKVIMTQAEYVLWGLPVINVLVMGYIAREMVRVHSEIDELNDKKYVLKGA
ncbi:hypothetical protein BATDEDRAFT_87925 [Batrachochytrium dendrobatidis JAM81]|uniref:Uncharacterized protein n=1 Tax=Batrachochytrium dendrobatidis (strain JAM81 / FGSC 10211) TaxID=684364 RepID=F4P0W6_BATDJ|nr:uncharacterized protein BATDEDRAFT_87925 [Batrachochytrium dendrobatidis JAM81]EGF81356.1 hypothetical protein BATDEDRAFT_87925 [Batrachochytrium dendrobatidis JAM81]|eukprot:XP_006678180.1 hypothetical protein BATDEDRAFT_87925 [Batrachochytrium dendrobatidis JAM81]